MICRKATFTLSVSAITLPDATCPSARAQKVDFVLETPDNGGSGARHQGERAREEFRYGFETCADCSFKASCEKLAPFMENEVARKNMNL